jgi:hypothetical protein
MKKFLLLLFTAVSTAFVANAQLIDWSTDAIIGLDTIRSTDQGTPLVFTIVMKNNGPDTVQVGDSLLYQMVISTGSQVITSYPSTSSLAIRVMTKTLNPMDTIHIRLSLASTLLVRTSGTVSSTVISHLINRPARNFEVAPGNANNVLTKSTVWLNPQGWPVGLAEQLTAAATSLKVYPNPVNDVLNFDMEYNKPAQVVVMDVTGKSIATTHFELGKASLNVNNFSKGIYFYQVSNDEGKMIKAGKFTVN